MTKNIMLSTNREQHREELLEIKKLIGGNLCGCSKSEGGFYVPDMISGDEELELEMFWAIDKVIKFTEKWKKQRFDNNKPNKRILIVSIDKRLKKLFDEVYVTDDIKKISEKVKNKSSHNK